MSFARLSKGKIDREYLTGKEWEWRPHKYRLFELDHL